MQDCGKNGRGEWGRQGCSDMCQRAGERGRKGPAGPNDHNKYFHLYCEQNW